MAKSDAKILLVDDEDLMLDALQVSFHKEGFDNLLYAKDGVEALALLNANPDIELVLLDWMMPKMDGMELLKKVKRDKNLKYIPIIMQSVRCSSDDVNKGVEEGCLHYLAKPYGHSDLISHVYSAMDKFAQKKELMKQGRFFKLFKEHTEYAAQNIENMNGFFRRPKRAMVMAQLVSLCFKKPATAMTGLYELFMNAIEHGNLGISFEEKSELLAINDFHHEVKERLRNTDYKDRKVKIRINKDAEKAEVKIIDEGLGFDSERFLRERPVSDYTLPNGRGLKIASEIFDELKFEGNGNIVVATQYC